MLDEDWATINMMLKYYKLVFGRATDYMNEEIRAGRVTREQAQAVSLQESQCGGFHRTAAGAAIRPACVG